MRSCAALTPQLGFALVMCLMTSPVLACSNIFNTDWETVDETQFVPHYSDHFFNGFHVRIQTSSRPIEGIAIEHTPAGISLMQTNAEGVSSTAYYPRSAYDRKIEVKHLSQITPLGKNYNHHAISALSALMSYARELDKTSNAYIIAFPIKAIGETRVPLIIQSLELVGKVSWDLNPLKMIGVYFNLCLDAQHCVKVPLKYLYEFEVKAPISGFSIPKQVIHEVPEWQAALKPENIETMYRRLQESVAESIEQDAHQAWKGAPGPVGAFSQLLREAESRTPELRVAFDQIPEDETIQLIEAVNQSTLDQLELVLGFFRRISFLIPNSKPTARQALDELQFALLQEYIQIYDSFDRGGRILQRQFDVPVGGTFLISRSAAESFMPTANFTLNGQEVRNLYLSRDELQKFKKLNLQVERWAEVSGRRLYQVRVVDKTDSAPL